MRRVIFVSAGAAGAKGAARLKRLAPEIEVKLVVPAGENRLDKSKRGPFARLTASKGVSETQLEARQVGLIEANDINIDFENKKMVAATERGTLPVQFSEIVLDVDAMPRLPRSLRSAENVVPWPVTDGALVDELLEQAKPAQAVVVGGMTAMQVLSPLLEKGIAVTWLRTASDSLDKDIWQAVERAVSSCNKDMLTVKDWSSVRRENILPVLDDNNLLTELQDGQGNSVSGDVFFWSDMLRALHPVIAEEGVELDASGLIAVDERFATGKDGLYLIGSGVAAARRCDEGKTAPVTPATDEASVVMGRVVADSLAGLETTWGGSTASARYTLPCGYVLRSGLTVTEAQAAGYETEFAICSQSPKMAADIQGDVVVKLVCDKNSRKLLGMQAVAPRDAQWADALLSAASMALAGGLTVDSVALTDMPGGGGELLSRVAGMIINKLQYRIWGITPDELLASKEAGAQFFMLDLRDQISWKSAHIDGAYNIPYSQLKKRLQDEVPRFTPLVLIARTSDVPYSIACMLHDLGAKDLYVLDGGMELWPYDTVSA